MPPRGRLLIVNAACRVVCGAAQECRAPSPKLRHRRRSDAKGLGALSPGPVTHLAAIPNADASLSVFGIGRDGRVRVNSEGAPGVAWSGWKDLRGTPIAPGFAVAQNLSGLLEVVGVDPAGRVW